MNVCEGTTAVDRQAREEIDLQEVVEGGSNGCSRGLARVRVVQSSAVSVEMKCSLQVVHRSKHRPATLLDSATLITEWRKKVPQKARSRCQVEGDYCTSTHEKKRLQFISGTARKSSLKKLLRGGKNGVPGSGRQASSTSECTVSRSSTQLRQSTPIEKQADELTRWAVKSAVFEKAPSRSTASAVHRAGRLA